MTDYLARALEQNREDREPETVADLLNSPAPPGFSSPWIAPPLAEGTPRPDLPAEGDPSPRAAEPEESRHTGRRAAETSAGQNRPKEEPALPREDRPVSALLLAESFPSSLQRLEVPAFPAWGRAAGEGQDTQPLLTALRRAQAANQFVRQPSRALAVTLPDTPAPTAPGVTAGELDRAVERDARRYDGGFSLY